MARTQVHGAVTHTGVPSVLGITLRDRNGNTVAIGANDRFICQVASMSYARSAGTGRCRLFIGDDDTFTEDETIISTSTATLNHSVVFKGEFEGARGKTPRFDVEFTSIRATVIVTGDVVTP